ncbi:MAG: MFS transporter [Acidobacteriia bacterium]|nr:MFS transporter [Terriglobia bacterium]
MPVRVDWLSRAAYSGMFFFGVVMAVLGAALPLLAVRISFDLSQAGNLFLAMNLAMLTSGLVVGPFMDRFGKKPVLIVGPLFVAAALALMATAATYGTLVTSVALLGLGGGALNSGTNTLVADLHSDPRAKSSALNLLGIFFGFGALFLPFVIGSLVKTLGLAAILYITVVLALVPAALCAALAFPPSKHKKGLPLAQVAGLAHNRLVLSLGFLLFFESGNEFIMGGYTSTYLTRQLNSSVPAASLLLAAYWGAIMVGRAISSRLVLKWRSSTLILASAVGAAAGVVILLAAQTEFTAGVGIAIAGLSFASVYPVTLGFAGSRFEAYSGSVFGILFAIALVGGMTLPWAVGQLAQAHGLRSALAIVIGNCAMIFLLQLAISARTGTGILAKE